MTFRQQPKVPVDSIPRRPPRRMQYLLSAPYPASPRSEVPIRRCDNNGKPPDEQRKPAVDASSKIAITVRRLINRRRAYRQSAFNICNHG